MWRKGLENVHPNVFFLFETFCTSFFFNYISSENVLLFFLQKKDKWDLQKIMSLFSNPDHVLKRPPLSELLGMEQSSSHIFVAQIDLWNTVSSRIKNLTSFSYETVAFYPRHISRQFCIFIIGNYHLTNEIWDISDKIKTRLKYIIKQIWRKILKHKYF